MKRTSVRRVSVKKRRADRAYHLARALYLAAHPVCERCGVLVEHLHHRRGRVGSDYTDPATFMSVCHSCHRYIHDHDVESRARGWLLSRLAKASA